MKTIQTQPATTFATAESRRETEDNCRNIMHYDINDYLPEPTEILEPQYFLQPHSSIFRVPTSPERSQSIPQIEPTEENRQMNLSVQMQEMKSQYEQKISEKEE